MRKRFCFSLVLLLCLTLLGTAFARESAAILVDDAPYTSSRGCAVTHDGNTVLALSLRYEQNRTEGEHPLDARLVCMGEGGAILWEQKATGENSLYSSPCVLSDGTVLAIYKLFLSGDNDQYASHFLRAFSSEGELLGEVALPDTTFHYVPTESGILVTFLDHDEEDRQISSISLYDQSLAPVWRIDGIRRALRYDCAVSDQDGLALLYREMNIREELDEVRLLRINAQGEVLWTAVLAEQQMGYMSLRLDGDGNRIVYLGGLAGSGHASEGTLYCFDSNGAELWRKPIVLPDDDIELCDSQLTEDGCLLMGLAKTATCVRLYRFDGEGRFTGSTDHSAHEELAYRDPAFAELSGKPYACVIEEQEDGDRMSVYLLPLTMPQ